MSGREQLLTLRLRAEADIFLLRQRGREVAQAVGLDTSDQIKVATALSDLGRALLDGDTLVTATFRMSAGSGVALDVELSWQGAPPTRSSPGWRAAARLLDEVHTFARGAEQVIVLLRRLPRGTPMPDHAQLLRWRAELSALRTGSALDELRAQNDELLTTLADLERKQAELLRLNAELESTNQGVLALYTELSTELEQTNQGVLALYAELEEKSTALAKASAAKTRFWSNVSHELRTPVNSVIGLARLLLDPAADPLTAEQQRQVELVDDAGHSLLGLIGQLLDVAKAESGRMEPRPAPVDLCALFERLADTFTPMIASSDVTLVVEPPPAPHVLRIDATMLDHILRNLLSNGIKYTKRGEVRLTARPDGTWWRIRVRDTGIGIPAEHQDRIFEEFYQVPGPLQAPERGSGLGLPFARLLAETLGGSLDLDSEPDVGTSVTLRIPGTTAEPLHLSTVLLVTPDDALRGRLRNVLAGLADVVLDPSDVSAMTGPPDLIVAELGADSAEPPALRAAEALGPAPKVLLAWNDNDAAGQAGVVLHRSRLSVEAVQEAIRRALSPGPVRESEGT